MNKPITWFSSFISLDREKQNDFKSQELPLMTDANSQSPRNKIKKKKRGFSFDFVLHQTYGYTHLDK